MRIKTPIRHTFTLVELLVVIAVISALSALLLPALQRARRSANEAACINNLKRVGMGVFLYTADNRNFYPDRSTPTHPNDDYRVRYKGRYYTLSNRMQTLSVSKVFEPLREYHGNGDAMGEVYTCPFAKANTLAGAGTAFPFKYKSKSNNWAGRIGNYNLCFGTMWDQNGGVAIRYPMRRIGEGWTSTTKGRNGSANRQSFVVASDKMRNNQFGQPNANHPPAGEDAAWLVKGSGPGWIFDNYASTSAAYLLEDGSVDLETQVSQYLDHIGGDNSFLIPVEHFQIGQ